jgi:peptidylprolyl isomerase
VKRPLIALAGTALALPLLAGCWTSDTTGEPSAPSETVASTPAVGAPEAACPAGTTSATEYSCEGVTVTGAAGEEPTISLAEDFGPASELLVADVYEGQGDPVAPGATLTVQYVGVGEQSREVFDSSWARGAPATFPLDGVIEGWQQGMLGMAEGGRRLLIIPGALAYGPNGNPDAGIGPDDTLVFVVDLVEQTPAA